MVTEVSQILDTIRSFQLPTPLYRRSYKIRICIQIPEGGFKETDEAENHSENPWQQQKFNWDGWGFTFTMILKLFLLFPARSFQTNFTFLPDIYNLYQNLYFGCYGFTFLYLLTSPLSVIFQKLCDV